MEKMDTACIELLYLLFSFAKFCALNVAISFSDWTTNGELFGIHMSPGIPEDPTNISSRK